MIKTILKACAIAAAAVAAVSCTTTYDAYGRPVQSVDPGTAALGAAAAGVVGYAIADNKNDDRYRRRYHHPSRRHYYRAPYRRGYYYR